MRCRTIALVALALIAVGVRAHAEEVRYVEPASALDYQTVAAPLPSETLGAIAAGLADRARATARGTAAPAEALFGPLPADAPPAGWPARAALAARGAAPLAGHKGSEPCRCGTDLGDAALGRVAVLYAARRFTVGDELARLSLLRLTLRANDGVIAYLNGIEVARRRLARDLPGLAPAARASGPEWEAFVLPLRPGLLHRGDNLLTLEVRPSLERSTPTLDVELVGQDGAHVVRGPLVQRVGDDHATLVFDTDLPVAAAVDVGATTAYGQRVASAGGALAIHHVVELGGLPAHAAVHYRVVIDGSAGPDQAFHTAPAAGDVIRFAVYGDMRGGHDVHAQIIAAILGEAPDFVLVTGDLVLRGTDEADWQRFFQVVAPLVAAVPYYPVVGNHDLGTTGDEDRRATELFALPPGPVDRPLLAGWYAFDVADLHVVVLDSNAYERKEQLAWLEQDLAAAAARKPRAIFAAVHDGPFSRGAHGGNPIAARSYVPLLAKHQVTLLFSGHDHLYQRGKQGGLDYIVSGGGGAPLYPVSCGVKGKRRCAPDGMKKVDSTHHYLAITVRKDAVEVCPKRPDGTAVEKCVRYKLPRWR